MKAAFEDCYEYESDCKKIQEMLDSFIVMLKLYDDFKVNMRCKDSFGYYKEWSIYKEISSDFIVRISTNVYGAKFSFELRNYWFDIRHLDKLFNQKAELNGGIISYEINDIELMTKALIYIMNKNEIKSL